MKKAQEYKEVVEINRIRRITGYITGSVERFNDAKFAEMKDRTKHMGRIGLQSDAGLVK